ncbi:AroM family protein [Bosea vestrisii]|uniref:AroM family protein n=1 Tax=Bosea vestrisii TaxID=151416 RepID=UPI0024DFE7BA|nr:AroM family protein [Bosea vestrisii]WID98451.1 AroM family protein [Bosea vestrisii]
MAKLGTLTIGQAPRADITPILDSVLGPELLRLHAGVLDGLSRKEISRDFAPEAGGALLITKLLDGTSVVIDRQRTERAAQTKLAALEAAGCSTILMLCTGHFASLRTERARLIEPDRILPPTVAALVQDAQLGIIVPLAEQIASEAGKWAPLARPPIYAAASPYGGDGPSVLEAAEALAERGADILLMDCMGFVERHRQEAAAAGLPVILSNALIAKIVSEVV